MNGSTSFSDTAVTPGITYIYRVQGWQGKRHSEQSDKIVVQTPPATVKLTVFVEGKNVRARLDFTNLSSQIVYLDKVNACANGKIGANVFRIQAEDGRIVEFKGKQAKRPRNPGPDQLLPLVNGSSLSEEVNLNSAYRFPKGAHDFSISYSAEHKAGIQDFVLTSSQESVTTPR